MVFFRPEDVEVASNGVGHPATVEFKIFLGATSRLHLVADSDGQQARFYADLPSRRAVALEPGTRVSVRVEPGDVRAFPIGG